MSPDRQRTKRTTAEDEHSAGVGTVGAGVLIIADCVVTYGPCGALTQLYAVLRNVIDWPSSLDFIVADK